MYRLFAYPAMARQYRRAYRYWLIDEFQDTNGAQYALRRRMAGQDFREDIRSCRRRPDDFRVERGERWQDQASW